MVKLSKNLKMKMHMNIYSYFGDLIDSVKRYQDDGASTEVYTLFGFKK
ncbi:MAG: hypothetical protein OSJ65_03030 [Bacilli bacterium]|nr:hypothetical protein [Bacilli bacterium]